MGWTGQGGRVGQKKNKARRGELVVGGGGACPARSEPQEEQTTKSSLTGQGWQLSFRVSLQLLSYVGLYVPGRLHKGAVSAVRRPV